MKQFIVTASLLLLTALGFGQIVNDNMSFFNYNYDRTLIKKNKVETVTIEIFFLNARSLGKTIYHFNKEGSLTKQTRIDTTGVPKSEFCFRVNSQKDLILRIQKDYENNRIDTVVYFKSYEGSKLIRDSSSEIPISYNLKYTKNGQLIETTINSNFGLGNNTKRVIVNKINSSGRIINISEIVYQNEGDLKGSEFSNRDIFYNDRGKVEKEIEKINNNSSRMANKGSISYLYDSRGNLTHILKTNAASYIFTYNDKGLITTKKTDMTLESDDFLDTNTKIEFIDKYSYTFRK